MSVASGGFGPQVDPNWTANDPELSWFMKLFAQYGERHGFRDALVRATCFLIKFRAMHTIRVGWGCSTRSAAHTLTLFKTNKSLIFLPCLRQNSDF